jgi:group I intron endonuclease
MACDSGIYAIVNTVNNKMYVGSTVSFKKRWSKHRTQLKGAKHQSKYLQSSYKKYGKECFSYEVIEYVEDKNTLLDREQVWLDFFKPQYNWAKKAYAPTLGKKLSDETRAKMSAARIGKPAPFVWTEEMRRAASEKRKGVKLNLTPEERERRKKVMIGNKFMAGIKTKGQTGRIFSDQHRKNLSSALLALPKSAYDSRRGPRKKKVNQ